MASTGVTKSSEAASPGVGTKYNFAMGHLRAFVVALVVAHHAMLAYHPAAPSRPPVSLLSPPRAWTAYPVIDSHRAAWAGILATFNDIWLMVLMFFVSGLFMWASLNRKGPNAYLCGRLWRLGLPFIPAAVVLAPLAYYPTYLQMTGHGGFGDYMRNWISLGSWSAGPVWFLWVLLVFDCVAVLLVMTASSWMHRLSRRVAGAGRQPAAFFAWLTAVSGIVYVPLVLTFGMFSWAAWGPFVFQKSRILLYLVYFVAGIAVGAQGLELGLLAAKGKLARQWPVWVATTLVAFLAYWAFWEVLLSQPIPRSHPIMADAGRSGVLCGDL
jgi:hypothetical protein